MTHDELNALSEEDQLKVGQRMAAALREGAKSFNQDEMETKAVLLLASDIEADIKAQIETNEINKAAQPAQASL